MFNHNYSLPLLLLSTLSIGTSYAMRTPTFSIKNNSFDIIQIDLRQNGKSVLDQLRTVAPGLELSIPVDTDNKKTILHLFFCSTKTGCDHSLQKKLSATFPMNKTIYIKFDGKKIEVQKGSSGQTVAGFSTAHNVTNEDFTVIESSIQPKRLLASSTRQAHAQSVPPARQAQPPTPTMPHKTPPAKPKAAKPYHDLAWAKFPAANSLKNQDRALMNHYYSRSNDPRVRQLAQAVLEVSDDAEEKALEKAYKNKIDKFTVQEFIVTPALYNEIIKIIDTAYAVLKQ